MKPLALREERSLYSLNDKSLSLILRLKILLLYTSAFILNRGLKKRKITSVFSKISLWLTRSGDKWSDMSFTLKVHSRTITTVKTYLRTERFCNMSNNAFRCTLRPVFYRNIYFNYLLLLCHCLFCQLNLSWVKVSVLLLRRRESYVYYWFSACLSRIFLCRKAKQPYEGWSKINRMFSWNLHKTHFSLYQGYLWN